LPDRLAKLRDPQALEHVTCHGAPPNAPELEFCRPRQGSRARATCIPESRSEGVESCPTNAQRKLPVPAPSGPALKPMEETDSTGPNQPSRV
jgi:hypothetical protein